LGLSCAVDANEVATPIADQVVRASSVSPDLIEYKSVAVLWDVDWGHIAIVSEVGSNLGVWRVHVNSQGEG